MRQATENRGAVNDGPIGATPGISGGGTAAGTAKEPKSDKEQRGNTPPGVSRGGDAPAAGAIVDPAGVTKR